MSKATKQNAVNWFELYVADFSRAKKFYETTLATTLAESQMEGCRMGIFPFDEKNGIGGAITKMDGMMPGAGGTVVYLNVEGDLDGVLQRAAAMAASLSNRVSASGNMVSLASSRIPKATSWDCTAWCEFHWGAGIV
jgi:uncharacterized protein